MTQLGRYDKRVVVQQVAELRDGLGDLQETWTTYATRWAAVEPLNGREFFASRQEQTEIDVRIRLQWDAVTDLITSKMRVTWSGRTFEVNTVIRAREDRSEVILMCTER